MDFKSIHSRHECNFSQKSMDKIRFKKRSTDILKKRTMPWITLSIIKLYRNIAMILIFLQTGPRSRSRVGIPIPGIRDKKYKKSRDT